MTRTTAIIGGGAMGSAIAAFLGERRAANERIVVIERDPSYRIASSSLSASSIRQQFSTPLSIRLSQFGYAFMQRCTDGGAPGAAVGLQTSGYTFLARPDQEAALRRRTALSRGLGAALEELDADALRARHPWLQCDDLSYAVRGTAGEGWFDGYLLQQQFRARARAASVTYVQGEATGFAIQGERVRAVRLADGTEIAVDRVVNAAGAWSAALGAQAGVALPVRPRRRTIFILSCPTAIERFPVLIDPSGVFVRPEQRHFLAIVSPPDQDDHDDLPLDPDFTLFEDRIWPVLAARVPAFEALRVERAWAGYYEFNTVDHNGIVGQVGPDNHYVATGFSGHGLMHSAGIGRGMAELLATGGYETIDLAPLAPQRFETGALIVEDAVY